MTEGIWVRMWSSTQNGQNYDEFFVPYSDLPDYVDEPETHVGSNIPVPNEDEPGHFVQSYGTKNEVRLSRRTL